MADRYWVAGGTGNYNSTTNWSATSGGASGASVPTSADNVFFNASSGVGTATINVASNCANLNLTGFTGTFAYTNTLTVNGSVLNFGTGGYTVTGASSLRLLTTMTITSNGTTYTGNVDFAGTVTYTLADNMTCSGTLILSSGGAQTINGNTLNISGNFNCNNGTGGTTSGTTNFVLNGTGTWSCLNPTNTSGNIRNNLTINTAGTITISGTVNKGGGTFTYTAGTVVDTGATLALGGSPTTTLNISGKTFEKILIGGLIILTSNVNATTFGTWANNNISFTLGGNSLNFTHLELGNSATLTVPAAWTCQNLEFVNSGNQILNNFSITINGNIAQSSAGLVSGSTTFTYGGTGTWTRTSTGYFTNSFTINTAGTLTITGANIGGGVFTYTAGTVITTGGTLWNRVSGTTFNHGNIVFNNVIFGLSEGSGSVSTVTLNNPLICTGTLTLGISDTTFGGTNGTFDVYGLILGTNATALRTTTLVAAKTYRVRQSMSCTQAISANRILINSTSAGTRAILTLDQGSTIDLGFVNATDINSSLGRPVYSYRTVLSNTLNWGLLPTDNSRASRSTFIG